MSVREPDTDHTDTRPSAEVRAGPTAEDTDVILWGETADEYITCKLADLTPIRR